MSAERSSDWSCGSLSGIMVVWRERVPDAILVVMMLAVGDVFCVAHCHLFTTVPKTAVKKRGVSVRAESKYCSQHRPVMTVKIKVLEMT